MAARSEPSLSRFGLALLAQSCILICSCAAPAPCLRAGLAGSGRRPLPPGGYRSDALRSVCRPRRGATLEAGSLAVLAWEPLAPSRAGRRRGVGGLPLPRRRRPLPDPHHAAPGPRPAPRPLAGAPHPDPGRPAPPALRGRAHETAFELPERFAISGPASLSRAGPDRLWLRAGRAGPARGCRSRRLGRRIAARRRAPPGGRRRSRQGSPPARPSLRLRPGGGARLRGLGSRSGAPLAGRSARVPALRPAARATSRHAPPGRRRSPSSSSPSGRTNRPDGPSRPVASAPPGVRAGVVRSDFSGVSEEEPFMRPSLLRRLALPLVFAIAALAALPVRTWAQEPTATDPDHAVAETIQVTATRVPEDVEASRPRSPSSPATSCGPAAPPTCRAPSPWSPASPSRRAATAARPARCPSSGGCASSTPSCSWSTACPGAAPSTRP